MGNISKPSSNIFAIGIPEPTSFTAEFVYNYYTADERTNEDSGIPEAIKVRSAEQIDYKSVNFSLRVPRAVALNWTIAAGSNVGSSSPGFSIKENFSKIVFEEKFASSKYIPYAFSNVQEIEDAFKDINNDGVLDFGTSQATSIDNFIQKLLVKYSETEDESNIEEKKQQLLEALQNIEKIADQPERTLGIKIYDQSGKKVTNTSGFDQLVQDDITLNVQLNSLVLPDIFLSSSFVKSSTINTYYQKSLQNKSPFEETISPVNIGGKIQKPLVKFIGYIIDRYEYSSNESVKNKTFIVESANSLQFVDLFVKYGSTYVYTIRCVSEVSTNAFVTNENSVTTEVGVTYYIASRPKPIQRPLICLEDVPPPTPTDLNFIWNYKKGELNIVWTMPSNPQRDIKQYQVFRRKTINEPFELLQQICFDFSTQKSETGELIDGNRIGMTEEEKSFVLYEKVPLSSFIDQEFKINPELSLAPKYIYTVAAVDAHGLISNYAAQFEVTFDFYQNKIVKRLISSPGAPRPYPNLLLNADLFKDVISVKGENSTKMKVYFMPEYFKIKYSPTGNSSGRIEKMVSTIQDNGFYQLQFINLQNQKSDSVKISINDPEGLTKIS